VKGTEFNRRAARKGGIRFQSLPVGKVTKEQLARKIVDLVENPRRALFYSRLYDVPVFLNRLFPGLVDLFSSTWVWWKRRPEFSGDRKAILRLAGPKRMPAAIASSLLILAALGLLLKKRTR
jgi:hypothetical protein